MRTLGTCALLWLACVEGFPSTLSLRILDEAARPAVARVRLLDADRKPGPVTAADSPALTAVHPNFPELGAIVSGERVIQLPPGRFTMVVERGPEYRRIEFPVDSQQPSQKHTARLERWVNMAAQGWWSGDLHVHRAAADMPVLMDAADLHFAPTLTGWNDTAVHASAPEATASDRTYTVDNCEDERHWGAALFIGVKSPMRLYPRDAEYPPPSATWKEARARGAFIDLEKLIWWEAPVISAITPPDSIGVAVNHFREDGISTKASLSRPRDESRYPGEHGFAQYILDLYSHYLSAGFRIPASAGSANGVAKNSLGYNRSYVYLGDRFSSESWLAGQRAGRNFVTNGPMLFVTVNRERPGAVLPGDTQRVRVEARVESAAELERMEIVVDGRVTQTIRPSETPARIQVSADVAVPDGGWLAVRCFEKNEATVRLAHTSPFYIGRTARRAPQSVAYLRAWVEAEMGRIQAVPDQKLTADQKQEFMALCRKALRSYQQVQ